MEIETGSRASQGVQMPAIHAEHFYYTATIALTGSIWFCNLVICVTS